MYGSSEIESRPTLKRPPSAVVAASVGSFVPHVLCREVSQSDQKRDVRTAHHGMLKRTMARKRACNKDVASAGDVTSFQHSSKQISRIARQTHERYPY